MRTGTRIKNTKSEGIYVLGDYVNGVTRKICNETYIGEIDYIYQQILRKIMKKI